MARRNPLNRLHLWNSRRQPRVISSKQAPIAAPAQPLDTVRTAGCCEQEKRRFRRHPFILLSRRSVQNPSILTIFSVFLHLPQAAGLVHSAAPPLKIAIALLDCDFVLCTSAQRWLLSRCCAHTRSLSGKPHTAATRASRCGAGVRHTRRVDRADCFHGQKIGTFGTLERNPPLAVAAVRLC